MTMKTIEKSRKSERSPIEPRVSGRGAKSKNAQPSTTTNVRNNEETPEQQSGKSPKTKHAQLLRLLSRPEGAIIEELVRATNWQQHSVRGFLAGTVKKKMGLALTSSKVDGEPRRYKIAARRGR